MQQYSSSGKGLNRDVNKTQVKGDSTSYVLNGSFESFSDEQAFPFIGNTPSNLQCVKLNPGEKIVGVINIVELDATIYALYNAGENKSSFLKVTYQRKTKGQGDFFIEGCCDSAVLANDKESEIQCEIQEILSTTCFKWSLSNQVEFQYKITDCSINLYFVNGLDQDRLVYFNEDWTIQDDFKVSNSVDDCTPSYIDQVSCEKTQWNPNVNSACLNTEVVSGGSKKPGKYNYLLAYSTNKGVPLTSFQALTSGTDIFSIGKESTGKGIVINVSNLTQDSRYRYYTIVAAESSNGVTNYFQKGVYPISQTKVYDFDNGGTPISVSVLTSTYPFYKSSAGLTVGNDILFKYDLQEYDKFNLQPVMNKVKLSWATIVLKEGDYKNPKFAEHLQGYLRDEVYAFGIRPIVSNGEKMPVYPLVGREATAYDLENIVTTNKDLLGSVGECDIETTPRWKIYNTGNRKYKSEDDLETLYSKCDVLPEIYESGDFAYWESTERYPNVPEVWKDLCGKPIRHFKFPDHAVTVHHSSGDYDDQTYIFPIGVKVDSDIESLFDEAVTEQFITQEQRDRIIGWELVRSNRLGNKSIVAKGIFYDVWEYEREELDQNFNANCDNNSNTYYFPSYPFNDLREDPFLGANPGHYEPDFDGSPGEVPKLTFNPTGRYTFHSPDTHFTEPDLGAYVKMEAELAGDARGFYNQSKGQAEYKLLNSKHYNLALSISKWLASKQESPTQETVQQLFDNVGKEVGSSIGGALGFEGIGTSVGSLVGAIVGKNIYQNNVGFQFMDAVWRNSIIYNETEKFINLFKNIVPPTQVHYQYQAVGKYNRITPIANNGNKNRLLEEKEYIGEGKHIVNNTFINNSFRESSVYLRVLDRFPSLVDGVGISKDRSRVLISDNSVPSEETITTTEEFACQTYEVKVRGEAKLSVWGELCNPIQDPNQTDPIPEDERIPGKRVYLNLNSPWGSRPNFVATQFPDGFWYFTDKVIMYVSTKCFGCGQDIKNPDDIEETEDCFRSVYISGYDNAVELVGTDPDETEDKIKGSENIIINEVESCPTAIETTTQVIKRACDCNRRLETPIASYYGSIKNTVPAQYGSIYDIQWLKTNSNMRCFFRRRKKPVVKDPDLTPVETEEPVIPSTPVTVITDITVEQQVDPCTLNVDWNDSSTFTVTCNANGTSQITVGVHGNEGHIVQFSQDEVTWFDANIGTNGYTYSRASNGQCNSIYFRVKGCKTVTWGCVLALTSEACGNQNPNPEECLPNCEEYSITNTHSVEVTITYEDCVREEYQVRLAPGVSTKICRRSNGSVIVRDLQGNTLTTPTLSQAGNCENCIVYVNSLGGHPTIDPVTFIHTKRFDPVYNPTTNVVTDSATYMTSEVKEYKIDEGPWFTGTLNVDLTPLLGKLVTVRVRFRKNSDPFGWDELYSAYVNVV